jgi:hypothetical protein
LKTQPIVTGQVTEIIYKHIEGVTETYLQDETEKMQNLKALPYVLGIIYNKNKLPFFNRKTLPNTCVIIIKMGAISKEILV